MENVVIKSYISRARDRCWELQRKYYGNRDYKGHDQRYREGVMENMPPGSNLLDAGCGYHMGFTREFYSKARMSVGMDIVPPQTSSPGPYGIQGDLGFLPFKDKTFDIIISKAVFEHLEDPHAVLKELSRVLKVNGSIVVITPNKYDYVSFVATLTPYRFHRWLLSRLLGWNTNDIFPTRYRVNSRKQIIRLFRDNDLMLSKLLFFNQYPAYLMFSPILFRLGVLHERITSRYAFLAQLRGWILMVGKKLG